MSSAKQVLWALCGEMAMQQAGGLADLDEVSVRVAHVAADLCSTVDAVDGEIGRVRGFLADSGDDRITHVLLQEGHLWGRKEIAIPISAVTGVQDGIRLNITKQQVEELPPADIDHSG